MNADKKPSVRKPPVEPDKSPDANTTAELIDSVEPSVSELFHEHRERTEQRLIEELAKSRKQNNRLTKDERALAINFRSLQVKYDASMSKRNFSSFLGGFGAILLAMASHPDWNEYKSSLLWTGIFSSIASILMDGFLNSLWVAAWDWWFPPQ